MIDATKGVVMAEKKASAANEAMKAKMREALDKKKAKEHASGEPGTSGVQKMHGVTGPVGPKQFRRKAGG